MNDIAESLSVRHVRAALDRLIKHQKDNNIGIHFSTGATSEEIDEFQKICTVKIPQTLIASLKACNGFSNASFTAGFSNVERILAVWKHRSWKRRWIFLYHEMDFDAVLDLDENSSSFGKVLCLHESSGRVKVWADSYETWFEMMVEAWMQHHAFRYFALDRFMNPDRPKNPYGVVNCSPHLTHKALKRSLTVSWNRLHEHRKTRGRTGLIAG